MHSGFRALVLALAIPLCAIADDQPSRIKLSDLEKTPIAAGQLKIRITRLRGSFLKLGSGSIEVVVENPGSTFETFSPPRLSLVDKENIQVNVLANRRGTYRTVPPYDSGTVTNPLDRRIAPGARVKENYALSGKVHLPIRLYYDEKLLAEIVE